MHVLAKSTLMKQVNNDDALLFYSAGACDIPFSMGDLDCGLVNVVRFLFLNLDFSF